ncbi:MAG TPA: chemotaxis protein CheA [Clostridiales bacterium]|nr:chemotaxis protein CheA [Clostridiales bacterium]
MLEMYVLENSQLLEQLEEVLLSGEREAVLPKAEIDEIFRVMHTIKGSSAMMGYDKITSLAHAVEDMFSKIREEAPPEAEWEGIFDVVLRSIDFFKDEIEKIKQGNAPDGEADELVEEIRAIYKRLLEGVPLEAPGDAAAGDTVITAAPQEEEDDEAQGRPEEPLAEILSRLTPAEDELVYRIKLTFEDGCQMETVRTFGVIMSLEDLYSSMVTFPEDLNENCDEEIIANGVLIFLTTKQHNTDLISQKLAETMFLQTYEFSEVELPEEELQAEPAQQETDGAPQSDEVVVAAPAAADAAQKPVAPKAAQKPAAQKPAAKDDSKAIQSFISVNVNKIDKLMNLVGEIVTTESMVTKNPDLEDLKLENFDKQARQLRKLTDELQDIVMSIRMVPIAATFHKMRRIVRDISKKTGKNAELVIIGEDTEVDKNIIDSLGDPLMHLIRNAMDHGMETPQERLKAGKPERGQVTLEALNSGGDVVVRVIDDGKGMNRSVIIKKAIERGLTTKSEEEISDQEAFGFTLMPGFSTKEQVSEYSGRGVGMDVVRTNIENIGGSIIVDSVEGQGTSITMHIPLTLAILNGMKISVGDSLYIVPILNIRESLEPKLHKIIVDPNGNEMIMIRGECYPVVRLHDVFGVKTETTSFNDGIMVLVETEAGSACLFAEKLLGEQQVVIKPMPIYITRQFGRIKGLAGCSVMGDGGIALILDINRILTY